MSFYFKTVNNLKFKTFQQPRPLSYIFQFVGIHTFHSNHSCIDLLLFAGFFVVVVFFFFCWLVGGFVNFVCCLLVILMVS